MSSPMVNPATCSIAFAAGIRFPRWPMTHASSSSTSGNEPVGFSTSDSLGPTRELKNRVKTYGRAGAGFPCSARWLFEFCARQ